jgi:hypothetical protein
MEVLPAPEGEDRTNRTPRLEMFPGAWFPALPVASFNVLHLLAKLVDDRF